MAPTEDDSGTGAMSDAGSDSGPGTGGDGDDPTACTDVDGDGYGSGCTKGPDCDDGNEAIHPTATEIDWDAIDQNCNGKLGKRLVQDAVSPHDPSNGVALFDNGLFVVLNQSIAIYAIDDLNEPVFEGPLLEDYPNGASFKAGTLAARSGGAFEILLFDVSSPEEGAVAAGSVDPEGISTFDLSTDGDTLYVYTEDDDLGVVLRVYDVSEPSDPELLDTLETDCFQRFGVRVDRGMLALTCKGQKWNELHVFDLDDPQSPALVASHNYDGDRDYFMSVSQGYAYFKEQLHYRRYPITDQGFGTSEELDMLETTGDSWFGPHVAAEAGLFTVHKAPDALEQELCLLTADELTPRCFAGLMDNGELYAATRILADGSQLLLTTFEHARRVDMSDLDEPALGSQWVRLSTRQGLSFAGDGDELIVTTGQGLAVYETESLARDAYAALDSDMMFCTTASGDLAYGLALNGLISVVSVVDPSAPHVLQRVAAAERPHRCQVLVRPSGRYLLVSYEKAIRIFQLDAAGLVAQLNVHRSYEGLHGFADDGSRLFVASSTTDNQSHPLKYSVSVLPLAFGDAPDAFDMDLDKAWGILRFADKLAVYSSDGIRLIDLDDKSHVDYAQAGIFTLFSASGYLFALTNDVVSLRVLTPGGLVSVPVAEQPNDGWWSVAALGNRIAFLHGGDIASFEVVDEH
ncbi:MAG: MopE-related protein [Myxococcales bacterium]